MNAFEYPSAPDDQHPQLAYREREEPAEASSVASIAAAPVAASASPATLVALLSGESRDLIVSYETGGKKYYETVINERPIWPGGESGVTIGCGYDLGYNTSAGFKKDWGIHLSASDFILLERTLGLTGAKARNTLTKVNHIRIPWGMALDVFDVTTLPKFTQLTFDKLPGLENLARDGLHGDCLGVLVSLVFNRGASFGKKGDRYKEMRAIRAAVATGTNNSLATIPRLLRDMKRLWRNMGLDGLLTRREDEAKLFERGLARTPRLGMAIAAAALESPEILSLAKKDEDDPAIFEALESLSADELDAFVAQPDVAEGEGETTAPPGGLALIAGARGFEKSDVAWIRDDRDQPDYRHLPPDASRSTFVFTSADLERLIAANHFQPDTGSHGKIIFALRGALLAGGSNSQENQTELKLQDVRPDHRTFRCVIGVYDRTNKKLSGYTASTVPNAGGVLSYYRKTNGGSGVNANLLPTGCYQLCVGTHFGSATVKGVFRLGNGPGPSSAGLATVLRSRDDVTYTVYDIWDKCTPADNIHPAFGDTTFSSLGCLTVMGTYRGRNGHLGEWAKFRIAAGLESGIGAGTRFDLVLLTGLDAATAVSMRLAGHSNGEIGQVLTGLRHGSKGDMVKDL